MIELLAAFFKKNIQPIAVFWSGLTARRKVVLVASSALVFTGILVFRAEMADRAFRPLYTGLTDKEAGMAVARLKEMQVPYKLTGGGGTILVPEPRLAEVRLQLATDGLPQSGRLGFELFDGANFGATEFAEHVNFRRALEGELERSLLSLSEVEGARVHISLPKRSVFLDHQQPSKASVVLQLRRGNSLSKEQVDAISFLVASAVEGLDARKVVVIDTNGRVLARPRPDGAGFTAAQLEYQRELEQAIGGRILATLEPYIGFDRVRSSVAVECDWNAGEQTEEILDPETVVMTSQRSQETLQPLKRGGCRGRPRTCRASPNQRSQRQPGQREYWKRRTIKPAAPSPE